MQHNTASWGRTPGEVAGNGDPAVPGDPEADPGDADDADDPGDAPEEGKGDEGDVTGGVRGV